jgi:ABC-2 type transport system permease protein
MLKRLSQPGLARSLALARHEMRVLARDPLPLALLFAFPLAVIAFLKPALALALFSEGYTTANGAEQAVPGVAVTFSFFLVGFVGLAFFREYGWGTWERLRASPAGAGEIMAGKILPILGVASLQLAVLFGAGTLVFGLRVRGSVAALVVLCALLAACALAMGIAMVAVANTIQQVNIVANLGTVVAAGLGGALVPVALLPGWTQAIAPSTPTYWAMRGFRAVVLDGGGLSSVLLPGAMLVAFTAGFVAVAVFRLRFDEGKKSWT